MRLNTLMPIMIFMTRYYNKFQNISRNASVITRFNKFLCLTIFALAAIFIVSCEENPTTIGAGLLPGSDFVLTRSIDTLSARSFTMYDDSIRSDNPSVSYLGQIYDPYFGTTTAGFVTQIRLKPEWDDLPFTIDSIKLVLYIMDVKGGVEKDVHHTLKISEISEQIYTDKEYYSNREVPLTGYTVDNIILPALQPDTINELEINLPVSFGEYLTRDTAKLFHNNVKPDFRAFFKGLYFELIPASDPLLLSLSLTYENSGYYNNYFVLFMHDAAGAAKEYYFIMDAKNTNAAYNKFSHDFTTAQPGKKILHINDGFRDTLSYLQHLNGVYTTITLPGLESLKNNPAFDNIGVNKARLIVPVHVDGDLYDVSSAPSQLYLRYRTKSGAKYLVSDYNSSYSGFFDGRIDTTAIKYSFNIPGFVQKYLEDNTGEIKPELEIFQSGGTKNVILKANNSKSPVKFELTYTKF
jgi:hypothetical protein